jgi:spore maturation protein SpmB
VDPLKTADDWTRVRNSIGTGARKGLNGFAWVMRILVPISFLTAVLVWSGWLAKGQFFIQPALQWLHLPAEAALPLLIGITTGIYGAIAAMAVLPLSQAHMTLIAVFLLIAHALIQESAIQGKSGLHPVKAAACRLAAATAAVLLVAPFLDIPPSPLPTAALPELAVQPFAAMCLDWLNITIRLALKVLLIIMWVLILLELLKTLGWLDRIVGLFRPVLRLLGLGRKSGSIWMTAAVFGLLYGAAVIVEEIKAGSLDRAERERLHLSIGINHAMVEDPLLFMSFGLNPFWLWVPRLVVAVAAVRLYDLWLALKDTLRRRAGAKRPADR